MRRVEIEEYEAMLADETYALLGERRREDGDIVATFLDVENDIKFEVVTG